MTTQSYANNTHCCLIFSKPSHTASLTCTNFWKSSCRLWLQTRQSFFKKLMCYSYSSHSSTLWSLNKYNWEWLYSSQTNKLTCHSSAHLRHKNHSQISFSPKTLITLASLWHEQLMLISVGVTTQKENTAIVGHLTWAYSASFLQLTREGFVCFTFLLLVIFLECRGKIIIFKFLI